MDRYFIKGLLYISLTAILLCATVFFWHRSRELSRRLSLIQERAAESRSRTEAPQGPRYSARVSIVIDDFGYNVDNINDVCSLGAAVTLSILPNLPYSAVIAEAAELKGLEVILHLPMEPYEKLRLEASTIMIGMTDEEIGSALEKAIASVPGIKGISNHMGSKATEDERVVSIIFDRIKRDDLYFLDSAVTLKSVCAELAEEKGVRFARRSVFLDNISDAGYIKGQIEKLAGEALAAGTAIGIGHDRALTISVIRDMLPYLKEKGIRVVPVSELAG